MSTPKSAPFLTHLTLKCASCRNGAHFFDISTSKSGPNVVCYLHFDLGMCFAPQRHALFSTSQLAKVVRCWCVLHILIWKCVSRHGICNFSSLIWLDGSAPAALARLLFDPPEPQIIGKTQCFATFLPLRAPGSCVLSSDCLFFDLFLLLFSLLFSCLLFSYSSLILTLLISACHLSILSEV